LPTPTSGTTPITPAPGVTEPGVTNQVPGTPAL
jgi:hypothetical protein